MAQIIREIRVDVSQPNVFQAIVAKQLDCNSRFLKITLVDFGVKIEVPETAKVTINANRPDGKSQSFVGVANNDGTITVPLAQWMLEVAGELKCDVSVINTTDNKRLTSTDFYVNVQEAANKSTDISENPDGEIRVITPTQKIDKNSSDDEYPSAKAVYELDNITATASGSAITVDSASAPLQNLKLFGKTEQNGTPTPSAPVPLVSVGDSGSFEVGVYGKNLLDGIFEQKHTVHNDSITTRLRSVKLIPIVVGKKYTITKYNDINNNIQFSINTSATRKEYPLDPSKISECGNSPNWQSRSYSFTSTRNGVMAIILRKIDDSDLTLADIQNIQFQVELGEMTDYEPYKAKQSLTMPYTLRGKGDIKDEIDFARGVFIQKCVSVTGFSQVGTNTNTKTLWKKIDYNMVNDKNKTLCSHTDNYAHTSSDNVHFYVSGTGATVYVPLDVDANSVEVIATLETPQEIPLTETELNAYRHLYTNKGNTTVLSECEDTEITYYVNKPNAQVIGSLHEQINKDYFKLQQAIISTGGSTL